ncbi:MAG: YdcF family protein [Proteobacteria bacterium]|nr:YdcF family protein [Pseudomonadota bacterium]
MDTFALLKILVALVMPPASLTLGALLALLLLAFGWRRLALIVLLLAVAQVAILSFQPVGDALMGSLESRSRAAAALAPPCCYDAIVVLGGGIGAAHPPELPEPHLDDGADRVWEAARLWKRGLAPRIIVSGGSFLAQHGGPPLTEADAMRVFLLDLGVPADAITDESKALNTIDNIRNVRAIIGNRKVALVTSAYHMPRALQLAALAGLDVGAFPTDYHVAPATRLPWDNWLPSIDGLTLSRLALHEIVALNLDGRRSSLGQ